MNNLEFELNGSVSLPDTLKIYFLSPLFIELVIFKGNLY